MSSWADDRQSSRREEDWTSLGLSWSHWLRFGVTAGPRGSVQVTECVPAFLLPSGAGLTLFSKYDPQTLGTHLTLLWEDRTK